MIDRKILADVTNAVDGTYYTTPISIDMFEQVAFQYVLSGGSGTVTLTLLATLENDPLTSNYEDITLNTFGVASYTASYISVDNTRKLNLYKWLKWKIVANTGGANDADYRILASLKTNINTF